MVFRRVVKFNWGFGQHEHVLMNRLQVLDVGFQVSLASMHVGRQLGRVVSELVNETGIRKSLTAVHALLHENALMEHEVEYFLLNLDCLASGYIRVLALFVVYFVVILGLADTVESLSDFVFILIAVAGAFSF